MSSNRDTCKHHKTRIKNCKGTLLDDKSKYSKWAYWCPERRIKGWSSSMCDCYTYQDHALT